MTTSTQTNYDRMSRWYDWMAASERPLTDAGLQLLCAQPGERVLEIGCGTGRALLQLARAVQPHGNVTGLDLSGGMLAVARQRLHPTPADQTVRLLQGDTRCPPLADNTFNAAFMSFSLELFTTSEIALVLSQVARVLQENGRLCVVTLAENGGGLVTNLYQRAHRRWPAVIDCRPINAQAHLKQAGFKLTDVRRFSLWGLPVAALLAQVPRKV